MCAALAAARAKSEMPDLLGIQPDSIVLRLVFQTQPRSVPPNSDIVAKTDFKSNSR
jgi:hypothetical protein